MAVALYDIDTLANVKVQLGIGSSDTTRDTLLQTLISDISQYFEEYTGRTFAVQDFSDEILDGNGRARIRPKHVPLYLLYLAADTTDADKLECLQVRDDVDDATWADIEDDLDHIWINKPSLREESANNTHCIELAEEVFTLGVRNIKLTYRAGYATIPGDIRHTFMEMVQRWFAEAKAGDNQLAQTNLSDSRANINISYKDMKPEWLKVLDRYRLRYQ